MWRANAMRPPATAGELQRDVFPASLAYSWNCHPDRVTVILSAAKDLDGMQGFAPSYEILRCAQQ
jgi:hypothetical protein